MKYEYLAGNPAMFIGMPSRVVVLVNAPHSVEGLTSFGDVVKTGMPVIAMRHIITEDSLILAFRVRIALNMNTSRHELTNGESNAKHRKQV